MKNIFKLILASLMAVAFNATAWADTFKININLAEGSEDALESVFVNTEESSSFPYQRSKGITPKEIEVEAGAKVRFNLNEDFNITSFKINGEDIDTSKAIWVTVESDLNVEIEGKAIEYPTKKAIVYITNPEGVTLTTKLSSDGVDIPLTGGEVLTSDYYFRAGSKTYTVPAYISSKYEIEVDGKWGRFFYDAKYGYWIKDAVYANPEDPSYPYAGGAVFADQCPVYINAVEIKNDSKAMVIYDGEANAARFNARNNMVSGKLSVDGISGSYLSSGRQEISFDSKYHQEFTLGKAGGDSDKEIIVYLNGSRLDYDDTSMSYSFSIKNGDVLKVFSVPEGTSIPVHTVELDTEGWATAKITHDSYRTLNAVYTSLRCAGPTPIEISTDADNFVVIDGRLQDKSSTGTYSFTTSGNHKVLVTTDDPSGIEEIIGEDNKDTEIFNLQGIRIQGNLEELPTGVYIVNGKKYIVK